jgi:hypothetical protein
MTKLPSMRCKSSFRILNSLFKHPPKQVTDDADIAPLDHLLIQKWHELGPLNFADRISLKIFASKNYGQFFGPRVI